MAGAHELSGERAALVTAVQRNCDIADARHGGELPMCVYLLQMRELYRWETQLPPGAAPPRAELGDWIAQRERHWDGLASAPYLGLPVEGGLDPFDVDAADRALAPLGLVYSAGRLASGRPIFVLAERLRAGPQAGLQVQVAGREFARGLAAPPGALHGDTVVLRRDALLRWLWQQFEAIAMRPGSPLAEALAACGHRPGGDPAPAIERLADEQLDVVLLHEIGEHAAGRRLGAGWDALRSATGRDRRIEPRLRALRDHLADTLVTLPGLLARPSPEALHFWFAMLDGVRLEMFPALPSGYAAWRGGDGGKALQSLIVSGRRHWTRLAAELVAAFEHGGAGEAAARLLDPSARCHD